MAIFRELASFFTGATLFPFGQFSEFNFYGANPSVLGDNPPSGRAVLLLHGIHHNQSAWIPLLRKLKTERVGAIYTLNYKPFRAQKQIKNKVEEIRQQFFQSGVRTINLSLVGHSLGAIHAANYAYHPEVQIPGISVSKVISIAGRLRWIEGGMSQFAHDIVPLVQETWKRIQKASRRGAPPLFTIAAERDWLVPLDSVLVNCPTRQRIIPASSHLSLMYHDQTHRQIIQWLSEP